MVGIGGGGWVRQGMFGLDKGWPCWIRADWVRYLVMLDLIRDG